jgi:hypothetical protein
MLRAFAPAHSDLARSGGGPAQVANERYIEALARIVYYSAYPAIDVKNADGPVGNHEGRPGRDARDCCRRTAHDGCLSD